MIRWWYLSSLLLLVNVWKASCELSDADIAHLQSLPGHLKPFGSVGPFFDVPVVQGFPSPQEFFDQYVVPSIPLIMKDGAKLSEAYEKWTDDYFIHHPKSSELVYAEARKKEVRTQPGSSLPFRDYVKRYTKEEFYMVNGVPMFLRPDVLLPPPLKCEPVLKQLADTVMWFSSGGTKSVLHNDDVDNINCLYRGNKTLIFVSPFQTDENWISSVIDHPEGTYSDVDVDSVDFVKYPSLSKHKYGVANMKQGDCLFIPYKWAHQVNSFGNNLAVNIWFNHMPKSFYNMTKEQCGEQPESLLLSEVQIETTDLSGGIQPQGNPVFDKEYNPLKDDKELEPEQEETDEEVPTLVSIMRQIKRKPKMDIEDIKAGMLMMMPKNLQTWDKECENAMQKLFNAVDLNSDNVVDKHDKAFLKGLNRKERNGVMDEVELLYEGLINAFSKAQRDFETDLIKKMVRMGEVDFSRAKDIYGDKFLEGVTPLRSVKEEL